MTDIIRWYLVPIGDESNRDRRIHLCPGGNTFGRDWGAQHQIGSVYCDMRQCYIDVDRDALLLWDYTTTNGTFVNNVQSS